MIAATFPVWALKLTNAPVALAGEVPTTTFRSGGLAELLKCSVCLRSRERNDRGDLSGVGVEVDECAGRARGRGSNYDVPIGRSCRAFEMLGLLAFPRKE